MSLINLISTPKSNPGIGTILAPEESIDFFLTKVSACSRRRSSSSLVLGKLFFSLISSVFKSSLPTNTQIQTSFLCFVSIKSYTHYSKI